MLARLSSGRREFLLPAERPFSNFGFAEAQFLSQETAPDGVVRPVVPSSIQRLFSQARHAGQKTILVEGLSGGTDIVDENLEIVAECPDHQMSRLVRISWWSAAFTEDTLATATDADLIGFAVLKQDEVPSRQINRWHVFESVFRKSTVPHNFVPCERPWTVRLAEREFTLRGVPYYQQNGINKACAQVAIKTLLAINRPEVSINYSDINRIAAEVPRAESFVKSDGLDLNQISRVFSRYGLRTTPIDYPETGANNRGDPGPSFQQHLYAGLESGGGAMVGFRLAKPNGAKPPTCHVMPVFGHTFNRDTWVPSAEVDYFLISDDTKYVPSEKWLSSFLVHDDNLGSHFCIPRSYLADNQVVYALAVNPSGALYDGIEAEALAAGYLFPLLEVLPGSGTQTPWTQRLNGFGDSLKVVMRAVACTPTQYLEHLGAARGWAAHIEVESPEILQSVREIVEKASALWMIEISVPELFPTNLRKLGEIVLNAGLEMVPDKSNDHLFLLARLPGCYLCNVSRDEEQVARFQRRPSGILSHCALWRCDDVSGISGGIS